MADATVAAGGGASRLLSVWHDLRLPIVLGMTFVYVYWKYCFYQPRETTISKKGGKSGDLRRPPSDDEDEDDNRYVDIAQERNDKEEM
ncbi:hypothetical protein LIPSTDRAFT_69353, partial [Lipomyces starkeyi NRRL Y-11557]